MFRSCQHSGPTLFKPIALPQRPEKRVNDIIGQKRIHVASFQREAVVPDPDVLGRLAEPDTGKFWQAFADRVFHGPVVVQQRRGSQELQRSQAAVTDNVDQRKVPEPDPNFRKN